MILCIRTDKPEAELYLADENGITGKKIWLAHKSLSDTILNEISTLLAENDLILDSVKKVVVFVGPGSFTGLRIGVSTANVLAYALGIPISGQSGEDWIKAGIHAEVSATPVSPHYGQDPHITQQKK